MERQDINQYKDIWVFAEQRQGKITPVVIELLGEGRKLADTKGIKLNTILLIINNLLNIIVFPNNSKELSRVNLA